MAKKDDGDIHEDIGALKEWRTAIDKYREECERDRKELVAWKNRMQMAIKVATLTGVAAYWVASHFGILILKNIPEKWIKSLLGE